MILVFLVMYLFLQNVRYTFIPAIVAPIALLAPYRDAAGGILGQRINHVRNGAGD